LIDLSGVNKSHLTDNWYDKFNWR